MNAIGVSPLVAKNPLAFSIHLGAQSATLSVRQPIVWRKEEAVPAFALEGETFIGFDDDLPIHA